MRLQRRVRGTKRRDHERNHRHATRALPITSNKKKPCHVALKQITIIPNSDCRKCASYGKQVTSSPITTSKLGWWPSDAEAKPIWEFCKALYDKRYLACAKNNEAFTRQELLNKILEKLGYAWTDNLAQPETKQDLEPDYIIFANDAEKEAVINLDAAHRYRAAVAILEAKKLHHPLSQLSKTQQRYPHQQIRDYLNEAQVLTGHPDQRQ